MNLLKIRAALIQQERVSIYIFDHLMVLYFDLDCEMAEADKYELQEVKKYLIHIYLKFNELNESLAYSSQEKLMIKYFGSVDDFYGIKHDMLDCESLALACGENNQSLIFRYKKPNAHAQTCFLRRAALSGDLSRVKYFAALGANVKDDVALLWARRFGYLDIINFLNS